MAVSNMNLIRALVSQLRETQALACGRRQRMRRLPADQNHNIPEISNFGDIISDTLCFYAQACHGFLSTISEEPFTELCHIDV